MTWEEIKKAVEQAGVRDEEEIGLIHCENGDGDHTFHKVRLGKMRKLAENVSLEKARKDTEGCAI
jgi:sialic acid synthase SpsE